ncbi:MAG TPA: hypothetical protein VF602_05180 [Pedobacter sp.]
MNLKKTGSIIAAGLSYFISVIAFVSFHSLPAFSQQNSFARLNLSTRTRPVQTTFSQENNSFFSTQQIDMAQNKSVSILSSNALFVDCGQGGSADNPTATPSTEPGGSAVSPNTKVLNPELAYDASESTYSTIYMDQQQKGVQLAQYILFNNPGTSTDQVRLKLSLTGDLLNDNDYTVTLQGYMGSTALGTALPITTGLTTNQYQYFITPGATFDRIKINILTNNNGNKKAQINVHYVTLIAPPPVFPGSTTINGQTTSTASQCEGSVILSISNPDASYVYKWYNSANTYLATGTTYSPPIATGTYIYYVEAARGTTCPSSAQHKINLTVNPKPAAPTVQIN